MRGGVGKLSRYFNYGVYEMSDTKFTPGPWVFNGNEIVAANEPGKGIAGAIREDDCRLIAASPDLYSALDRLFGLANHFNVSGVYFTEDSENFEALKAAENALSRARGES